MGKTPQALKIENDDLGGEGTRQLVADALSAVRPHLRAGAAFYICAPSGMQELFFRLALVDARFELRQAIVWVKDTLVAGRQDYQWRHESILAGEASPPREHEKILTGQSKKGQRYWAGGRSQDTVWEIPRPKVNRDHPTMKPLELVLRALAFSCPPRGSVLDPFLGSGTTLLAAEHLDRRCIALELDPRYVDVAVERWKTATGGKPELQRG